MAYRILILNGPGLADLRDDEGHFQQGLTLARIRDECARLCRSLDMEADFRQTDDQQEMVDWIAKDGAGFDGIVINPAGYSRAATVSLPAHLSAFQMKALLGKPVVEVHIENVFSDGAAGAQPMHEPEVDLGFVCGLGVQGYLIAIRSIAHRLHSNEAH